MNKYLAIDIGASSGRHLLGRVEGGQIVTEEIYRFSNELVQRDGHLCWDLHSIFDNILEGLCICKANGVIPVSVGIDTWGVDFVLLDKYNSIIGDTFSYRDSRTDGIDEEVESILTQWDLYQKTGIQKLPFNTIYQLAAVKKQNPLWLEKTEALMMIPDYFNFLLTGKKCTEYTNASTTSLLNARDKTWDYNIIDTLGLPERIFLPIRKPGSLLGLFQKNIIDSVGFCCELTLPATHDTASAYLSVPTNRNDSVYLSSGTWSLLGVELSEPNITEAGMRANYTNEGGYDYRFRYLKNYMGLWMVQSIRREGNNQYTYAEMEAMARNSSCFSETVDVNDNTFIAPESMVEAVNTVLAKNGKSLPKTLGETLSCIYTSLAENYADGIRKLENIVDTRFNQINIVGGGSKDNYLNELTAVKTGLKVIAGPSEATAIGNLLAQMLAKEEFGSVEKARDAVAGSFLV